MAELNVAKATVTDLNIRPFTQESGTLDYSEGDEVFVDFPNTSKYLGHYKKYGQIKKAIDGLWIYAVGKGYETEDAHTQVVLEYWKGFGEDTFRTLMKNMGIMSMVAGDAFGEVIRAKAADSALPRIINLKPISPERMRVVLGSNGIIKRYEQMKLDGKTTFKKFKPEEIFHIANDRIGDENHGTSVIECCEWAIEAIEEARRDYRVVLHRNVVPLRIIEVDEDDATKLATLKTQYKTAIKKGEVLIVPKGTITISNDQIKIENPLEWIASLENYLYIAVGIPRVIANPDALAEGASKMGYMIFDPIYTDKQTQLEDDIWQQLAIKVKFKRPPSLQDSMASDEAKNTSQTNIQPKDASVTLAEE